MTGEIKKYNTDSDNLLVLTSFNLLVKISVVTYLCMCHIWTCICII